jgi:dimethylargininase
MRINRFKHAVVKRPSAAMIKGITSATLGEPNFDLAMLQHNNYNRSLKKCGLHVEILDSDNNYPDSCFIEDVAICTPKCAIITNPGAASRKGEIEGIDAVLQKYYETIERIKEPGTVEGGDIMMVGNKYFIGISERTNQHGADQLIKILESFGYFGIKVPLKKVLHLKTGLSYLENNNLLISGEFIDDPVFKDFNKIIVEPPETYAVNSVWINGFVITPAGFPKTLKKIQEAGYEPIPIDVSEYQKLDGGLSCLSLRF